MIRFENLALRRGAKLLFSEGDVQIHPGYKVGVTGANGVGKSSLFSMIVGELQPDSGNCRVPPGWEVGVVEQEDASGSQSAIDHVIDGDVQLRAVERQLIEAEENNDGVELAKLHVEMENIDGYSARSRAAQVLDGLGFSTPQMDQAVDSFSGGWRMRLNLARVLMRRSDLLLLDEPTNHLDLDAIVWLEQWLRRFAGTLLLISHDRDFLDRVVDHVLNIEKASLRLFRGNYTAFERRRAEQLSNQKAQYERQQREIKHIQSYVDRFRYKASKARQAQSRLKALERMALIVPAHVDSPFGFSLYAPRKTSAKLLGVSNCSVSYGKAPILSDVSLHLTLGDRIGLLGANGAGKSTLIKLLAGELAAVAGEREEGRHLQIGYFAQSQLEQLQVDASPLQHLRLLAPSAGEQELRNYLGGFGFSGEQAASPVGPFSGGEKSRLVLALLIYQRPNLLLLDEPTNHLDLEMRQALANALQEFTGAMVLVSHDRHLLRVTCDELLLVDGGRVVQYDNSLDEYARWLGQRDRRASTPGKDAGSAAPTLTRKQKKRNEAKFRKRLLPLTESVRTAEEIIEKLRKERGHLESAMADNDLYTDSQHSRLTTLISKKSEIDQALTDAEADWLQASEDLETAIENEGQ